MRTAGDRRQIHRLVRRGPILRERILIFAEHAHERRIPAESKRGAIHLDDLTIAPAAADVRPQRLAVAIREEARIGGELLDRRELVAHHGVAHPHRGERILASEREVLGHAFDEPERKRVEAHQSAARRSFGDVVLEDVNELVAEDVIVVRVDAGERHDDARSIRLR